MDRPPNPDATPRALVVDDSMDTATSTGELLTAHGFVVQVATCGRDAVHLALTELPDVVLLDLSMPIMDGFEVARQIRESFPEGKKRPALIAVTGYGSDDDRARTTAAGFDMHLIKPVEPAVLVATLRQWVSKNGSE